MTAYPPLFRLATRVIHDVRHRIARQLNLIEKEVYRRLQVEAGQVLGLAWRGHGADAFAAELHGELLPTVRQVVASIAQIDEKLVAAAEIMAQADEQAEATAASLAESFRQIYER